MRSFTEKLITIKTLLTFILSSGVLLSAIPAQAQIAQAPLLLGGGGVPGNLVLVPSVEYPTVISLANLGSYDHNQTYAGYFDPAKCYTYQREAITHPFFGDISGKDGGGYFRPSRFAANCANEWSGNYLNWATTQTIDPFRKALTGGYRAVDTASQTILEKATRASRNEYFANRTVAASTASAVTPYSNVIVTSSLYDGTAYQKNKTVRITRPVTTTTRQCDKNGKNCKDVTATTTEGDYYTVRVEVCVAGLLENNCVQYGSYWKPEGLIQQYQKNIRYSVFGYVAEDGNTRNGGVLRTEQKYVGETKRTPGTPGEQDNPHKEWNPNTGVLNANPESDSVGNSGVINYINKFGELTNYHKSNDPVSELYYAALRYVKNQGNVTAWSTITNEAQRDKFPIVTNWSDPIQYACQKNVILGIGDVNTHADHDVPSNDDTLDVRDYTQKVFTLEGITTSPSAQYTGRSNSAYIAGLAYYANISDIRPSMAGKQTVSTHWVDVRENQALLGRKSNQYWLAAKYGGFKVPKDYVAGTALADSTWWTSNETLSTGDKRPDNFYVASDAQNMIESLKSAFAQISKEMESTTGTLATNSTRLATDTAVFQSLLNSKYWSGDLMAKTVASNGTVASTASWNAAKKLDSATPSERKIFTPTPLATATGSTGQLSTTAIDFTWSSLDQTQKSLLQTSGELIANDLATAEKRLDYLRGDRSQEKTDSIFTNPFRQRRSVLGDIINSDPQYTYKEDYGYNRLIGDSWNNARSAYTAFLTSKAGRTPLVVVGANDGMLHGFNASVATGGNGGDELFAFIPNSVFTNLKSLPDPAYSHRYYVDGTPRISDVWFGSAWHTIVAGTTGAGGNSVFALDITDPSNMTKNKFLWEFSHPDMGYTIGQPAIVALPNGKFSVVVTSGYHDTARTEAKVWFLDAADGAVLHTITLTTSGDLGAALLADTNGDQIADRLYVGDTQGKLWRVDMDSSTASSWGIPNALSRGPLFTATKDGTVQPITAPPASAFNEKGEHMVLFGTGTFIRTGDNEIPTSPPVQSFYGIIDGGSALTRDNLQQQQILKEVTVNNVKGRSVSQNAMATGKKGWYLDLAWTTGTGATGAKGERVISKPTLRNDRVTFTTMTPSADPCASGGTSWIMALNLNSGGRLNYVYFDTNKDGALDNKDTITDGDDKLPVSGISNPDDGVVKGATPLYRWLCYAGSAGGAPQCIKVAGSQRYGRHSWQEMR